jgi:dCTP diphosphatase
MNNDLERLRKQLAEFAAERDWDQFHAPKNLIIALMVEAAELAEHFQWVPEERSRELSARKREEVELELADIFIYLIRLADKLGVDLVEAADKKIVINEQRYPAARVRGSSKKYSDYDDGQ